MPDWWDFGWILGQRNTDIGDRYVEMMVMVDKAAVDRHRNEEELKRYILTYLKLVSGNLTKLFLLDSTVSSKLFFLEVQ